MTSGPLLVLVTGLPCSGKTGVAARLSSGLGLPMLAKDDIKEALFDTLGYGGRERSLELSGAAYAILYRQVRRLLSAGLSLIAESNFDPDKAAEQLAAIRSDLPFDLFQIQCHAPGPVLVERFRQRMERGRHPGHADRELFAEIRPGLERGRMGLLDFDGDILEVDTTDFPAVNHELLAAEVRRALEAR